MNNEKVAVVFLKWVLCVANRSPDREPGNVASLPVDEARRLVANGTVAYADDPEARAKVRKAWGKDYEL